jgi:hypothetical protein
LAHKCRECEIENQFDAIDDQINILEFGTANWDAMGLGILRK